VLPQARLALLRSALLGAAALIAALALATPAAAAGLPDDALAPEQWQLRSPLDLPDAWDRSAGEGVIVAVVDTGVDLSHPDLRDNLWTNPREIAGNGVDDDGNGYVDDVHGYDFASHSPDPTDQDGHGTAVAGAIAARGNNHIGVSGVAPRARIMALKVSDGTGPAPAEAVAEAIRYATANGARIVNVSLNSPDSSPAVEEAVRAATAAGVLVVASAGNQGQDLGAAPSYPASYDGVLGVGAVNRAGQVAPYSNTGAGVDILAPGDDILSTGAGGDYATRSGTSMAAAEVSGALALVAAAQPDAAGPQLAGTLLSTGQAVGGSELRSLNAGAALRQVHPRPLVAPAPRLRILRPRVTGRRAPRALLRWRQLVPGAEVASFRVVLDGRTVARRGRSGTSAWLRLRPGRHTARVVALGPTGRPLASRVARLRVS
jgi:subtilisin family serine protease